MSSIHVMLNYLSLSEYPVTGITCGHYQFGWMDEFTNKFDVFSFYCFFVPFPHTLSSMFSKISSQHVPPVLPFCPHTNVTSEKGTLEVGF